MWETVQKFGLAHCDLPTMLWNLEVMLRILGVKIERTAKSIPMITYVLTAMALSLYSFTYHACTIVYVLVDCKQTGDILAGIMVLSISLNSLIGANKFMYIYMYQKKIQTLVTGYKAYDRLPLAPATIGLMASTMRNVKTRYLLCFSVTMCNAFLFNLQAIPIFDFFGHKLYDKHVTFGLQYILGVENYPFTIFSVFTCTTYLCYVTVAISSYLIVTVGYSEGRLLAHSQEMRDLWSDALSHYKENYDERYTGNINDKKAKEELNMYIKHRIRRIVESHVVNINLIGKTEDIFRNAILVEFILLAVGLIVDLLGGLKDTFIILPYTLMQVGMDCFVGQRLVDASNDFENAVYDCKWENFDADNRKTVLFILIISQKTLSLSAGSVAKLNYASLMVLYKTVYSAYTALRSTML